jgi:ubiquinone/menaquinone biosynthesis C-methylase UbiE
MAADPTDPAVQFDRVAAAYATSAVHASAPDLEWLVDALAPQPHWHVLDLGTGAGHAAMAVAPHVRAVDAIDVAPGMLAVAGQLARTRGLQSIAFHKASASALPFPAASLDGAVTRFSAHHWPELQSALNQARRVLRLGAPLVIIDSISPESAALDTYLNALELLRDASHVRNPRLSEWCASLERAGFTASVSHQWLLPLAVEDWLARSATPSWRAMACRDLLRTASVAARLAFQISEGADLFHLPIALITATAR